MLFAVERKKDQMVTENKREDISVSRKWNFIALIYHLSIPSVILH